MFFVFLLPFCDPEEIRVTVLESTSSAELSHSLSSTSLPFMSFLLFFSLSYHFLLPLFFFPHPSFVSFFLTCLPSLIIVSLSWSFYSLSVRGQVCSQGARAVSSVCDSQGTEGLSRRDHLGQLRSVVIGELGRLRAFWMGHGGQSLLRDHEKYRPHQPESWTLGRMAGFLSDTCSTRATTS